jgi:hypothetical protein
VIFVNLIPEPLVHKFEHCPIFCDPHGYTQIWQCKDTNTITSLKVVLYNLSYLIIHVANHSYNPLVHMHNHKMCG